MERLELDDIQGIILSGYGLKGARFVLLRVSDAARARDWLAGIADALTVGAPQSPDRAVNVAFTSDGLAALGLDPAVLSQFASEFRHGMHGQISAALLGDDLGSVDWHWGGPGNKVHLALLLFAAPERIESLLAEQRAAFAGVKEVRVLLTTDLGGREHFGFADGVSQPVIEHDPSQRAGFGVLKAADDHHQPLKAGEVLLGYADEEGRRSEAPAVPSSHRGHALLPPLRNGDGDLGRNGSYMVLRQFEQDVPAFWKFIAGNCAHPAERELLAAKLIGRTRDGVPLAKAGAAPGDNDFGFAGDLDGFGCPLGAHIRRANPRDERRIDPGSPDPMAETRRHRMIRRGRPYGPPLSARWDIDEMLAAPDDAVERGLNFLCFVADIGRQFEFLHWKWLNERRFVGLPGDTDPIVGAWRAWFTVQGAAPRRMGPLPSFVRVRGGAYFFAPGRRAVRFLAALD